MSSQLRRVEIGISGMVQGVFFRQEASQLAQKLGLVGCVRNEPNGSVRIVAEGKMENLQKLIEWCNKGTPWSKIDRVDVIWCESNGEFKSFIIR